MEDDDLDSAGLRAPIASTAGAVQVPDLCSGIDVCLPLMAELTQADGHHLTISGTEIEIVGLFSFDCMSLLLCKKSAV